MNWGEDTMPVFNVYQDSYIGATIISNRFIDEYMNDANDAQIKVYLYLVRMLNAHLETSVADIADRFNHTEKDVMRAFKYWERRGLLTLDMDADGVLIGVHLVNLCKGESNGPTVEATHKKVKIESKTVDKTADNKSEAKLPMEDEQTFEDAIPEKAVTPKPSYSAKDLLEFSEKEGSQLVFLAETYFARPLSQTDLQTLVYINDSEGLGLSEDLVDYLLQYCAESGKRDFRYAEKVAIDWKEKGITTVKEAAGCNLKYDKIVYSIMNRLGKQSAPTEVEVKFINKWINEYGFSESVIMEACDRTVLATDKNRIKYADGMLSSWREQGVRNIEDIRKLDDEYHSKKSVSKQGTNQEKYSATRKHSQVAGFNSFQQTEIDFDELSKKIFVN